ncbi:MAG: DUF2752 domain-containing protein [Thermoguttaceae bacterium]|nr:DUF2752 domain-containing protein [Thermoguttaceae bacterium]
MASHRRKFWILLFSGAFVTVGVAALLTLKPGGVKLPPCLFHETTGFYCPGCGSTRALQRLLRGDVLGAFRHNLLVVPGLVAILYLYVCELIDLWLGDNRYRASFLWIGRVALVLLVVYAVVRNLSF